MRCAYFDHQEVRISDTTHGGRIRCRSTSSENAEASLSMTKTKPCVPAGHREDVCYDNLSIRSLRLKLTIIKRVACKQSPKDLLPHHPRQATPVP